MIRRGERRHDDGREIEAAGRREGWTTGEARGTPGSSRRRGRGGRGSEARWSWGRAAGRA
mgnify:CR=1 FL=1